MYDHEAIFNKPHLLARVRTTFIFEEVPKDHEESRRSGRDGHNGSHDGRGPFRTGPTKDKRSGAFRYFLEPTPCAFRDSTVVKKLIDRVGE